MQTLKYQTVLIRSFQKPDFKKDPSNVRDIIDRIWDEDDAKSNLQVLEQASFCSVSETKKRSKQSSQRLYDLTTLQREANRLHSLPASRTLQIAQALYEKPKVTTYPRTDSKALPDYVDTKELLQRVSGDLQPFAQKALNENWVNLSDKRVFNNKQSLITLLLSPPPLHRRVWMQMTKIYNPLSKGSLLLTHLQSGMLPRELPK